jgi:phosphatidylglycerophosphatase A
MKEQKIQGPSVLTTLFLSWFYSGKVPKAPGTFGSLATLPLIFLLHYLQINIYTNFILKLNDVAAHFNSTFSR